MKINLEDVLLGVGLLCLIIMYIRYGLGKVEEMLLTFTVSSTIFYFIASKIHKKLKS